MKTLNLAHSIIAVLAIAFSDTALAQPFLYDYRLVSDPRYAIAYRINLATGQEEVFLPDSMRIRNIWPDPSQKWVYVDVKGDFLIVDANNPSTIHRRLVPRELAGSQRRDIFLS
jgi:hypothetical protein